MKAKKTVKKVHEVVKPVVKPEVKEVIVPGVKEVKPVEPKEKVYTEAEKQFIKDNNMDEYNRLFGKGN